MTWCTVWTCGACGKKARTRDADNRCSRCSALARRIHQLLERGELCRPDFQWQIKGKTIDRLPARRRDALCSACGGSFTTAADQDTELGTDGRSLYLHPLCRKILLEVERPLRRRSLSPRDGVPPGNGS